jgi:hypothetical protein
VARALRGARVDLVIVPATALKDERVFLDDVTLEEMSQLTGVPVVAASTPGEATAAIRRFDRGRHRR